VIEGGGYPQRPPRDHGPVIEGGGYPQRPPRDHGPVIEGGGYPQRPPRGPDAGPRVPRYPGDVRFPGRRPPVFQPGPGGGNVPFPRRRLPIEEGGPVVR
jgi:hypothetical protein